MSDLLEVIANFASVSTILRVTTPIALAGLGILISERAGVLNIGVEGLILIGALAGVVVSASTGSAWVGLFAALIISGAFGGVMSFFVHVLRTDLFISGMALNIAALSGTTLILFLLTGDKGMSGDLPSKVLPNIDIPLIAAIPVIGPILSGHHVLTYLAIILVPIVSVVMGRTPFGLRLRAVGESPESARIAGISVPRTQFVALVLSGVFAGAAGAFLSMGYVSWFASNMSAGRGFIALAAEMMGMGSAWGTFFASVLLGTAESLAISMQGIGLPSELMQTVPYLVPVVVMVLHSIRRRRRAEQSNQLVQEAKP